MRVLEIGLDFQLYNSTELRSSRYTRVLTNAAACGAQRQAEMFYDVLNGHSEPVPLAVQLSQCREQLWSSGSQHSQGMEAGWTSYWRLEMNRYLRDKKCKCVHLQCFHFKAVAKLLFSLISLPSLQKGLSKVLGAAAEQPFWADTHREHFHSCFLKGTEFMTVN